ncbi:MAG: hypothetical protein IPJ71_02235 [Bdellovibrionales bacterium]|nr:hypothetical protein [Bdellovibrionales bacterium]
MKQLLTFKKMKAEKADPNQPLENPSRGCFGNVLTPITLSGVVAPWDKDASTTRKSEYKLVCTSGLEYFLVTKEEANTYIMKDIDSVDAYERIINQRGKLGPAIEYLAS